MAMRKGDLEPYPIYFYFKFSFQFAHAQFFYQDSHQWYSIKTYSSSVERKQNCSLLCQKFNDGVFLVPKAFLYLDKLISKNVDFFSSLERSWLMNNIKLSEIVFPSRFCVNDLNVSVLEE